MYLRNDFNHFANASNENERMRQLKHTFAHETNKFQLKYSTEFYRFIPMAFKR